MDTASISDVLSRISSIEQQLQQLQSGSLLDSALGVSTGGGSANTGSAATASTATAGSTGTDFANALAQASTAQAPQADATGAATTQSGDATVQALLSALLSGGSAPSSAAASSAAGVTLPAGAASELTSGQQQFAATLSAQTGLSPSVVSAWLLAEESGGAAQSRQAQGNNDWLNIGYTDSATYGSSDSIWSDPVTAAQATAAWLKGQNSIPGYGTASSGVQSILQSVGGTPEQQIEAIQSSGWSSGGYPALGSLYDQVTSGSVAS